MADFPALPLWTDALLGDTTHLSAEEFGIYLLLLITAWRRPQCDLPDDNGFLARVARVGVRRWRTVRPVMEGFHDVANGAWTQKRLLKERDYARNASKKMREMARVRWNKNNDLADADASGTGERHQNKASLPKTLSRPTDVGFSKNNDLADASASPQHMHPYPLKKVSSVHEGVAAAEAGGDTHAMDEANFTLWVKAISSTIPRGWSRPKALRQWQRIPFVELDVITQAWRLYLADCAEKTKGSRYPQRTMYPENWIRDRIYESFVDLATANLKRESELNTARAKTLQQYNGHAKRVLDAIGKAKFDAWLIGSRLVAVTEHEFIIATPRAFAARYINEHDALLRLIGKALGGKVTVQLEAAA